MQAGEQLFVNRCNTRPSTHLIEYWPKSLLASAGLDPHRTSLGRSQVSLRMSQRKTSLDAQGGWGWASLRRDTPGTWGRRDLRPPAPRSHASIPEQLPIRLYCILVFSLVHVNVFFSFFLCSFIFFFFKRLGFSSRNLSAIYCYCNNISLNKNRTRASRSAFISIPYFDPNQHKLRDKSDLLP